VSTHQLRGDSERTTVKMHRDAAVGAIVLNKCMCVQQGVRLYCRLHSLFTPVIK